MYKINKNRIDLALAYYGSGESFFLFKKCDNVIKNLNNKKSIVNILHLCTFKTPTF